MKPRAVLITPTVPATTGNGLAMRAGVWLEILAETHDVDLVVVPLFPSHPSAPAFARQLASTITIAERAAEWAADGFVEVTEAAKAQIAELTAECDAIIVFRLYLSHLAEAGGTARRILDLDDVDWVRERRLGNEPYAVAVETRAAELGASFDVVTVANRDDIAQLRAVVPDADCLHLPNIARDAPIDTTEQPGEAAVDLLFVGTLGYAPNLRGACWFLDEVLPLLSGVSVAFAGAQPPPELLARQSEQVRVIANGPAVTPWYRAAQAVIVPLHAGSGSRTKVLEAWAHGVPVISTPIGLEGIDGARESGAAAVAESANEFASACRTVLTDSNLAASLVARGSAVLDERYRLAAARVQIAWALGMGERPS